MKTIKKLEFIYILLNVLSKYKALIKYFKNLL